MLTTNHKLLTLLFAMLTGFATLSFLLFKHQNEMQQRLNNLYFGSFIPISNLKEIVLVLDRDIALKLYHARDTGRKPTFLSKELLASDQKIAKLWESYALSYKNNNEKKFVYFVDKKLQKFHAYMKDTIQTLSSLQNSRMLSLLPLMETTRHISALIEKLIDYESQLAAQNRKEIYADYTPDKIALLIITLAMILLAFLLYFPISKSIKNSEKRLIDLALDLDRVNKELHQASITDGLTQLYNRRYFDQIFANEIKRATREKLPVTYMMLDIDHFKKYNDHYGHPAGDAVIQKVAKHLRNYFKRPGDLIFRLGGEEFGVFLHSSQLDSVTALAQQLIADMQKLQMVHETSLTQNYVTLSMGMVHFTQGTHLSAEEIYQLADEQLYKAKESGRDRVVWLVQEGVNGS